MARNVTSRPMFQSSHTAVGIAVARRKGGWAGAQSVSDMWELPKRELLEVALRLGAVNAGFGDSVSAGRKAVLDELDELRESNIV